MNQTDIESLFNQRELKVLHEAMQQKDMSAAGIVRHFFRMGQMMDMLLQEAEGNPIGYLDDQGDFHAPYADIGPKMAPMPDPYSTEGCTCEATDGKSCPIPLHQPAVEAVEDNLPDDYEV